MSVARCHLQFKVVVFAEQLKEPEYRLHNQNVRRQTLVLVLCLVTKDFITTGWYCCCRRTISRLHVDDTPQVGKCLPCCATCVFHLLTKLRRKSARLERGNCYRHNVCLAYFSSDNFITEASRDTLTMLVKIMSCQLLHSCTKNHIWKGMQCVNDLEWHSRSLHFHYLIGHIYHFTSWSVVTTTPSCTLSMTLPHLRLHISFL